MSENKNDRKKYGNEMPVVDEDWWASLLADEQKHNVRHDESFIGSKGLGSVLHTEEPKLKVDWEYVNQVYSDDRIVEVQVVGQNSGGLLVDGEGLSGFIPSSHLVDLTGIETVEIRNQKLSAFLEKSLKVKIIECSPENERIIFSERAALTEPGRRVKLFEHLQRGMNVKGRVTNITDFGVFIDLGGAEGLIHVSELSWGRVTNPRDLVNVGDEIDVQVLDVSSERCRVGLSRKRLLPNPWENASTNFPEGSMVDGTITSIVSFGAFAILMSGVEGLIHATEMPLDDGQSPKDLLSVGQTLKLRILHIEPERQRLGFSMKLDDQ